MDFEQWYSYYEEEEKQQYRHSERQSPRFRIDGVGYIAQYQFCQYCSQCDGGSKGQSRQPFDDRSSLAGIGREWPGIRAGLQGLGFTRQKGEELLEHQCRDEQERGNERKRREDYC